jgi:hypothetical protein
MRGKGFAPLKKVGLASHIRHAILARFAEQVLNYLGRYVHRIALTTSRILSTEDGQVYFRYQDSQDQRWQTMTLPAYECIRRFLQHVSAPGVPQSPLVWAVESRPSSPAAPTAPLAEET